MKALVTGATGFVGSHLAELLLDEGWEVAALVRAPKRKSWLDLIPAVRKIEGSLEDPASLAAAAAGADYIFHAAGLVKARSEGEYLRTNGDGTRAMVEAALKTAGSLKRFVYISSQASAGPAEGRVPVTEKAMPRPITPYGRSKLTGERAVLERAKDLPATIIRPPAVYGPRDRDIFIYFKLASLGIVPIVGRPDRILSLVHVLDLVRGILEAALSSRAEGETYFITSGDHDWKELSQAVSRAVGRGFRIRLPGAILAAAAYLAEAAGMVTGRAVTLNRYKAREILQDAWLCSRQKAAGDFGFQPRWSLEEGMGATAAWYRKEGWI